MNDATAIATRVLARIRTDLLEGGENLDLDSDLFAAGLDSMSIMQLTMIIEEDFGVQLADRLITRATFFSARSLAQAICDTRASRVP